jgi:glycosyltransferase involved in cell wall biosynthesis
METISKLYMRKLIKLIKGSDIIHCIHGGVSYLGYAAWKASRQLDIPFVYTPVLHLNDENRLKNKTHTLKDLGNAPILKLTLIPRGYTDKFWLKICQEADALVTMTDFESKFFSDNQIASQKIFKIGVGPLIGENSAKNVRHEYHLQDKNIVLFLGRNAESKGIEELLAAARIVWQQYPDTHFVFAGPKEGHSEKIFDRYRDPRILALGSVSERVKANWLKTCDIFCMPSREESLGGTFLEAWMYEKPIIAAKIPPLEELTENGAGGFLVTPIPTEIADKIRILIQSPDLRQRMGEWGKNKVLENYTWEIISNKLNRLYSNLVFTSKASAGEPRE